MAYRHTPVTDLLAVLLGAVCGAVVGFVVTFAGWVGADPEACCPVDAGDPIFGAFLGTGVALWGRIMRRRYERDTDETLQVRSRKRRW